MLAKKVLVKLAFKILGRGLVSCSRIENAVKEELDFYEEAFVIDLRVLGTDTKVAVQKRGDAFAYLGSSYEGPADLSIIFKSYESALLLALGRIGVYEGYSQHRFIVRGDFIKGMPLVRCLYYVEAYLFPNFINRKILKEIPKRSSSKAQAYVHLLF